MRENPKEQPPSVGGGLKPRQIVTKIASPIPALAVVAFLTYAAPVMMSLVFVVLVGVALTGPRR